MYTTLLMVFLSCYKLMHQLFPLRESLIFFLVKFFEDLGLISLKQNILTWDTSSTHSHSHSHSHWEQ